MLVNLVQGAFALVVAVLVWRLSKIGTRETALPPGPPTLPVVGNLLSIPTGHPHLGFTSLGRQYGPVMSLKVFWQTYIILSSPAAVRHVIEKCNGVSQGRPETWLVGTYALQGETVTLIDNPETVSRIRRALMAVLTPRASLEYMPVLEAESTQMLYNLITQPEGWYDEIKRYTFSIMLSLTYGIRAPRVESPWLKSFFEYTHLLEVLLALPMAALMDLFPVLRHIPERFSGAKRLASVLREKEMRFTLEALDVVRKRLEKGGNGALMEGMIQRQVEWGLTDGEVRETGNTLMVGGSDTTLSFILSAILMLVTTPESQQRAHEELDRVIGSERLPTLDDISNLPYLVALVKEVERIRPPVTVGVPHRMTEDLEYEGYMIPKNAAVFHNSWGIGHDPTLFADPEKFDPERFLDDENEWWRADKSPVWAFGGGRRMCTGMYFARNAVHLAIARLLWGFSFSAPTDPATGKPVKIDTMAYSEGVLPRPHEFPCKVEVRSETHRKTIMQELEEKSIPQLKLYEEGLTEEDAAWLEASRKSL